MNKTSNETAKGKTGTLRRTFALITAILALLALCVFAAYKLGLFDSWLQNPASDPIETVRNAINNQADEDYTIKLTIDEISIDTEETERLIVMYSGSELAESRGWTDEYLDEHFLAVKAVYYAEYDHTKTFMNDGYTEQYFYLTQNPETGKWTITDITSPNT